MSEYSTPSRTLKPRRRAHSGAPDRAQREVAVSRSSKASLPEPIQAQLILDVNAVPSNNPIDYKFKWHDKYKTAGRDKTRKRFYYLTDIKCSSSEKAWKETVDWAKTILGEFFTNCFTLYSSNASSHTVIDVQKKTRRTTKRTRITSTTTTTTTTKTTKPTKPTKTVTTW